MAITRGTIYSLTLLGNQSIVVLNDASGHPQPAQTLMNTHGNYNTMMASILLASANKYQVELSADSSGIDWIRVYVQTPP